MSAGAGSSSGARGRISFASMTTRRLERQRRDLVGSIGDGPARDRMEVDHREKGPEEIDRSAVPTALHAVTRRLSAAQSNHTLIGKSDCSLGARVMRTLPLLKLTVAGVVATCATLIATTASAEVNWSVNVGVPGIVVTEPAPVYVEPAPVYAPPPAYYAPAPRVYYRRPPAYYRPAPIYGAPVYYGPPAPGYYRPGHWHRRDRDDDDRD